METDVRCVVAKTPNRTCVPQNRGDGSRRRGAMWGVAFTQCGRPVGDGRVSTRRRQRRAPRFVRADPRERGLPLFRHAGRQFEMCPIFGNTGLAAVAGLEQSCRGLQQRRWMDLFSAMARDRQHECPWLSYAKASVVLMRQRPVRRVRKDGRRSDQARRHAARGRRLRQRWRLDLS